LASIQFAILTLAGMETCDTAIQQIWKSATKFLHSLRKVPKVVAEVNKKKGADRIICAFDRFGKPTRRRRWFAAEMATAGQNR
jgi:hypothetical protein